MKFLMLACLFAMFVVQFAFAEIDESKIKIETVAENLEIPWSIVFSSDNRIFFTERAGNLRVIENGQLNPEPVLSLDVGGSEGGLLGLALDPNFEDNHYIYLYYTYNEFPFTFNKVVRYVENNNSLTDENILVDKIPGSAVHDGGRIRFGPDNKLYITTGDAANYNLSQDLNSLAGKILRINSDGTIPNDNPFPNSPVFSYGHRNPQGLDWHPDSKILVATEHGPSGERGVAHDEINVIFPGKNYGWPTIVGDETEQGLENPILHSGTDTWAPSGASFYSFSKNPDWYGKYFVSTLRGERLLVLDLDLENSKVISSETWFANSYGRLRDVVVGPDGDLYILTSNNDGRGGSESNDDRILRIIPVFEPQMDKDILSPKQQMKMGIDPHSIKCKDGLELVFKSSNFNPACVKPSSVHRLIEIGWASDHDPRH